MTDCNSKPMFFSSLGRKNIVADFTGGTLTSDAGGRLLREVERRLGLVDQRAGVINDPRDPARIHPAQRVMLAQRIFAIAMGYADRNDHPALRSDPVLAVLTGRPPSADEPLASSPTLCRLENRVTRGDLAR
ncbi:MAG: transposase, partial [Planctomycetes bacterium]|nr:transposase [Planctomycetota bacterium]